MTSIVFNSDPKLNHYLHCGVRSKDEFVEKLSQFSAKTVDMTVKLNLASFYTPESIPHATTDTVEEIIAKSLSAHIHYQFSYLPLIVQTIDALTQHRIPFKVLNKAERKKVRGEAVVSEASPYRFHLQVYAFFNDL